MPLIPSTPHFIVSTYELILVHVGKENVDFLEQLETLCPTDRGNQMTVNLKFL